MPLNTAKIDEFHRGVNLLDAQEELESGHLGGIPHDDLGGTFTCNVELIGSGEAIQARRPFQRFEVVPAATEPSPPTITHRDTNFNHMKPCGVDIWQDIMMSNGDGCLALLNPIGPPGTYEELLPDGSASSNWDFIQAQDSTGVERMWCLSGGIGDPRRVDITVAGHPVIVWPGVVWGAVNNPPSSVYALRVWKNRMILGGARLGNPKNRLWYSDIANPQSFPANNFIDIKSVDDENEQITGLEVIGENLLVFKNNSVWLVYDPVGFENRRIDTIGAISREAITPARNGRVYWVSRTGVYSTDGDTVRYESRAIEPIFRQNVAFYNEWFENTEWVRLISTDDNRLLLWQAGASGAGAIVFELDLNIKLEGGLSPWLMHGPGSLLAPCGMTSLISTEGHSSVGMFRSVIIGTNGGFLAGHTDHHFCDFFMHKTYDQDRPIATNGAGTHPLSARYVSPWLEVQGTENMERLRRVNAFCRGKDFTLSVYKDFKEGGLPDWDSVLNGGIAPQATGQKPTMLRWRPEVRGRLFRLKASFSHDPAFGEGRGDLHSIELKYRGGREH